MIAMSRKGFNRAADIPDYVLQALSRGKYKLPHWPNAWRLTRHC